MTVTHRRSLDIRQTKTEFKLTNIFEVQALRCVVEWNGQFASASANQAFQTIAALGSNSIELTARIWTQSEPPPPSLPIRKTESDASLLAGFQAAHAAGLSVVFKPAISALDGTRHTAWHRRTRVAFCLLQDRNRTSRHHRAGRRRGDVRHRHEMGSLSGQQYSGYWTDLISAVRQVYHGELTYAAATDEASKVSFWSQTRYDRR